MSAQICNGDGICLIQAETPTGYMKRDDISCTYNCQPVPCPNFKICGTLYPQCLLWCHKGTCYSCKVSFGHLQFQTEKECPICFENKLSVKQPKCNHTTCIDCFRECHLPSYWAQSEPEFPYDSEIENDYESDQNNAKWRNDPLIKKYNKEWQKWNKERMARFESESNLRVCPMCRK